MDTNNFITFEELLSVMVNGTSNKNFLAVVDHLTEALTAWPKEQELNEIIFELKNQIGGKLTYSNLDNYLNTLNPNRDAWKMEAITSLLKVFDFARNNNSDKSLELDVLLDQITTYCRTKSYC